MSAVFLRDSGGDGKGEGGLGEYILSHLQDADAWFGSKLPTFEPVVIAGIPFDFSITLHVVMLWLGSLLLITALWFSFRKPKLVPTGFAGVIETLVLFIRDEIAVPNIGEKLGRALTPFLCTIFLFILTLNLLGLIPILSTATSNLSVTVAFAVITFLATQAYGIKENGLGGYLAHLAPSGVPKILLVVMVPIEIVGLFTKPFALAMRLFANMIAGHTVIYALLGLIIVLHSVYVSLLAVPMAIAINLLEIFVAFLQAYIFTMLSALFIGMSAHPDH